jgi:NAD(P)-dependent dehydrogenase (short-subunit alcohol dehydrogenase family)
MMASKQKQVAIVTGGCHGIGLAMSEYLASKGLRVAVVDINADLGRKAALDLANAHPEATIVFKECDVTSWQQQERVFREVWEEFGGIDVVVANAGISEGFSSMYRLEQNHPVEPDRKVLDVNVFGVMCCKSLPSHGPEQKLTRLLVLY